MIIEQLVASLGFDLQGEGDLRRFNAGLDNAQRKASAFAASLIRIGAVAATAAAAGMAALGKSVISTSAQFESYAATLETIEGSSEKARAALSWVANFGKTTPYEVGEVTEAFVRLKAYGLDPMDGTLSAVGDAASAMGKSLMQGVEAVADAATGEFERLKEFGIKSKQAGDNVTFTWSQNGKALTKTVKKSSTEIIKFLKENMGERFSGAMMRQSKTWQGMVSNLSDTWVDFQRRVGDAGFFDAVKGQLRSLIDYLGRLDADGTLDRWSKALSSGLTKSVEATVFVFSRLQRHFQFFSDWVGRHPDLFKAIAAGLGAIAIVKFPFLGSLALLEDVLSWFEGGDSLIGDFAKALSELTGIDAGKLETIIATLAGAAALTAAAASVGLLATSVGSLAAGLTALGLAFAGAKAALDYLGVVKGNLDEKVAGIVAVPNPTAQPGHVESGGYDGNGDFIYMDGPSRRVDRPAENPQAGFTQDALDYKTLLENLEGNRIRMEGAGAANAVVNDNKQDNRDMSVKPNITINQTVQQATQAPGAAARATAGAVSGAVQGGLPPTRTVQSGAF